MNSFERLSKVLGGSNNNNVSNVDSGNHNDAPDSDNEMMMNMDNANAELPTAREIHINTSKPLLGKKSDKRPKAKKDIVTKSKIRGPKRGQKVTLRTSAKKK